MLLRERVKVHSGDCLDILDGMAEDSIDAVVTDPPYHFASIVKRFGSETAAPAQYGSDGAFQRASRGFMGKEWDGGDIAFRPETWSKVLRVMKPGAHLVAFGAPKNYHRLACAIEDAGFEIRDSLMWVFGSGFPKSLDVSKAIDKAAGMEREIIGKRTDGRYAYLGCDITGGRTVGGTPGVKEIGVITAPATDAAREWSGWGTALKPAYEPIVLARKPLSEKTVAANVLRWSTGAINIDATRVGTDKITQHGRTKDDFGFASPEPSGREWVGRWPANLCHDGSEEVLVGFPQTAPSRQGVNGGSGGQHGRFSPIGARVRNSGHGDEGSAARFFYCAKASKSDRAGSRHPTVKPLPLMRWLVRMITPPNGTVLDPFGGSGTTGQAAFEEGFDAVLIEREDEYVADIQRRMECAGLV